MDHPASLTESSPLILNARQWTIRQIMVGIAILAPLLALLRYPFAFGFAVMFVGVGLFVWHCVRSRRYERIAWLICVFPLAPLLACHLAWICISLKMARRSSIGLFEGVVGFGELGAYCCVTIFLASVVSLLGRLAGFSRDDEPSLQRAAWQVALFMPITWAALFAIAIWDPLGALNFLIR